MQSTCQYAKSLAARLRLADPHGLWFSLTRVANEDALPAGLTTAAATHDAWFRAKVREALDDPRPGIPHAEIEAHFSGRRARALIKAAESQV
jgi:DNA-damage-inducible protein J